MNDIRIGVKKLTTYGRVIDDEEPTGAVQVHWAIIDGQEVPGSIVKVESLAENGVMTVTIQFIASNFSTEDFRDKDKFLLAKRAY